MLVIRILDNRHKGVGQNCDQDRHNQEVGYEEEQYEDRPAKDVVIIPTLPCSGGKAHEHLEDCVGNRAWSVLVVAKRQSELMTISTKIATRSVAIILNAMSSWEK